MLGTLISGTAKVRLALWAVEMAIPNSSGLKLRFRSALLGVIAAVAGGVLAASIAVAALVGAGYWLFHSGSFSLEQSIVVIAIICVVSLYSLFVYVSNKFAEVFANMEEPPRANENTTEEMMHDLLNGFVEGLLVGKEKPSAQPEKTKSEPRFNKKKAA